jgi:uncharacterized coiled-coil protein SlyX
MDNTTTERIELKLAFLERANTELSDVVYRQQQEIDRLRAQLTALAETVDMWKVERANQAQEEERPPHY